MSATVTMPQKELIERLLKAGRWANASEVIRHGLELVRKEVEREDFRPMTRDELEACYAGVTPEEVAEENALAAASRRQPREADL